MTLHDVPNSQLSDLRKRELVSIIEDLREELRALRPDDDITEFGPGFEVVCAVCGSTSLLARAVDEAREDTDA